MNENLTPEQVREIKTVSDYRAAVKSERDYIGLMGYQPTLRRIRESYHNGQVTEQELEVLLVALYKKTDGEAEPFKSAKHFYHEMFAGKKKTQQPEKPKLSAAEQAELIKDIMPKKKKTKKHDAKPKPKKQVNIDPSLLPEELRGFLQ